MAGRVLLLQGPIGPFFSHLADELEKEGHDVFKIHFNGGDEACYRHGGGYRYTDGLGAWPAFLDAFLRENAIDRVLLFGDCRSYHQRAVRVAHHNGVAVFVFEHGYVRPDYITIEPGGVNGYSALSRNPADYASVRLEKRETRRSTGSGFWPVARHAVHYYLATWWHRKAYPHYMHHRPQGPIREGLCWLRSGLRKLYYELVDRPLARRLIQRGRRYYLAPLQVHCDAQMTHHSGGLTVEGFIGRTIGSFAKHAPTDTELVFKHHPMDRAYYNHARLIGVLARQYGVHGRVHYLHEGHLPTLLRRAFATVAVNSTVGLSSVLHRTPVKVLGDAVYDMQGLTCQKTLDVFWAEPGEVDIGLYRRYRQYLVNHVLGNGNFHKRLRADRGATGIAWPLGSLSAAIEPARDAAACAASANVREVPVETGIDEVIRDKKQSVASEADVGWVGAHGQLLGAIESHS